VIKIQNGQGLQRAAPVATFVTVLIIHFILVNVFPGIDPIQEQWRKVPTAEPSGWWDYYLTGQHFWLGYSYALAFGFAVYALLQYLSLRFRASGNLAAGGVTYSALLSVFGCFLVGCCGSPMLGVYLCLFGASFLPLAQPLVALVTTVLIGSFWLLLTKKRKRFLESECKC